MKKTEKSNEIVFDESYKKLSELTSKKLTRKELEAFMKENPGLITIVSDKEVREARKKYEEALKKDPVGRLILEREKRMMKAPKDRKDPEPSPDKK